MIQRFRNASPPAFSSLPLCIFWTSANSLLERNLKSLKLNSRNSFKNKGFCLKCILKNGIPGEHSVKDIIEAPKELIYFFLRGGW